MRDASARRWQTAQTHERELWESYADTYTRYPQILLEHLARLCDAGEFISVELGSPVVWTDLDRSGAHIQLSADLRVVEVEVSWIESSEIPDIVKHAINWQYNKSRARLESAGLLA